MKHHIHAPVLLAIIGCGDDGTSLSVDATGTTSAASTTTSSSTSTVADEGSSSSGTGSSSTTGPMPCVSDEECTDTEVPFCGVTGECGTCDGAKDPDGACAGVDPGLPLCVGGACVACTPENPVVCDDQLLLCDGDTNTCIQCTEHAQCGSGACELAVGRCFPDDLVLHVDVDGGADHPSVVAALNAVDDGLHGVIVVHDRDDGLGYQGALIDGGKTIALLAAPGEVPVIQGSMSQPGLRVEGLGTVLYMDGLAVSLSPAQGLLVDGAFAWVDRSRIVQNTGGAILAQNAAELTLRNCFVGGSIDDADALVVDGATATVIYSTLGAGTTTAVGLTCTSPGSVVVRNSLVVSRGVDATGGFDVVCDEGEFSFSATERTIAGTGNEAVGEMSSTMPQTWFMGYGTGDFHVQNQGLFVFADIAQWATGDPLTDIDGDPRPAVDATPDFAGADVP